MFPNLAPGMNPYANGKNIKFTEQDAGGAEFFYTTVVVFVVCDFLKIFSKRN